MSPARTELLAGARAVGPLLLGVVPFGLIYGVLARGAGIAATAAQAMSAVVFAGSAQFVAVPLLGGGAPGTIVLLTTLVLNLRHVLYSASMAPHLQPLGPAWKRLLAFLLTDEAYAVTILRYQRDRAEARAATSTHWYALGAGLTLWVVWQASTAAGLYLGAQVPPSWSLEFTLALTFIALVVPMLSDAAGVTAAVTAGAVAVLGLGLPLKLGLVAAALSGIAAGMMAEARVSGRAASRSITP
ncbi:MAG: AzlC family ABC transporter permease [Armatimonadota bacterium]|nr:AzlC family ABC transporter permease [Armatimonadota bacterium]